MKLIARRMQHKTIKYVAELKHVREVSLFGTADLAFWKDRLNHEDLVPAEVDGKAQIMIIAADSRFKGVRFREVSFCVLLSRHEDGIQRDAAYLIKAFNSCRFFAFCERTFFSTPYQYCDARVSAAFPAAIQLLNRNEIIFGASMQSHASTPETSPAHDGDNGWDGPVFLPRSPRTKDGLGKLFFARLQGRTQTYPFRRPEDSLTITPSNDDEVLRSLIDSQYVGTEWAVRLDATHGKSKTYTRAEAFNGPDHR